MQIVGRYPLRRAAAWLLVVVVLCGLFTSSFAKKDSGSSLVWP